MRSAAVLVTSALLLASGCAAVRPVSLQPPLPGPPPPRTFLAQPEVHTDSPEVAAVPAAAPGPAPAATPSPASPAPAPSAAQGPAARPNQLWWTAFADPALDAAIEEALRNNYTIRDLRNLIYENKLDPTTPRGPLWPLRIGLPATLQHLTIASPATPASAGQPAYPAYTTTYTDLTAGVEASYQVDVFGQLDAQRRTADDLVEQQTQSTETFAQALAEQVTQLWFEILEQRALHALLDNQIKYSQDLLGIVRARFEQHLTPHLVVSQQEQLLLALQSQLPLIDAQLALLNSRLTVLIGRPPTTNQQLVPLDRQLPVLPPAPGLGTPNDLLRESPEMRFAKSRVAEVEHLKNQNLSSWLPTIELFGAAGVERFDFSDQFLTSSFGVRLTYPVFDGGQRIVRGEQLELTIERRNWQYTLAFNTAMQRVQDALVQEQKQTDHVRTLQAQVELGRRVLLEARQLFEQGLSDYLPVLQALANVTTLERAQVSAQRLLLSYRVTLYHSLGGTWSKAATKLTN